MSTTPEHPINGDHRHDRPDQYDQSGDVDVLVGRIVDGVATRHDLDDFASLVANDETLLRRLVEAQRAHDILRGRVGVDLHVADAISIPRADNHVRSANRRGRESDVADGQERSVLAIIRPAFGIVGWAAAIVLALMIATTPQDAPRARVVELQQVEPHILAEKDVERLDPIPLRTEQLDDGRWRFLWIDRTLREVITDQFDPGWIQEQREQQRDDPLHNPSTG